MIFLKLHFKHIFINYIHIFINVSILCDILLIICIDRWLFNDAFDIDTASML